MDEGVTPDPQKPQTMRRYSDVFEECFPFYLSIGMSSTEYWDGDNALPKSFRQAYKMRQEQANYGAWLHGLYVYDAVCSAMSHLNSNKSTHKPYASKPYSFDKDETAEAERKAVAEAQAEVWMKSWVSATQRMFKK